MTEFIIPTTDARAAWVSKARCRSTDPDELFVRGAAQKKAAVICRHCPVVAECRADALDNPVEFGVDHGAQGTVPTRRRIELRMGITTLHATYFLRFGCGSSPRLPSPSPDPPPYRRFRRAR
jgi:Transcription factor WhiB